MRALTSLLSSLPLFLFVIAGAVAAPICSNQTTDGGSACQTKWFGNKLTGVLDGDVCRYTVRYGTAARWGYPSKTTNQR
jgi:hypothetical protein